MLFADIITLVSLDLLHAGTLGPALLALTHAQLRLYNYDDARAYFISFKFPESTPSGTSRAAKHLQEFWQKNITGADVSSRAATWAA